MREFAREEVEARLDQVVVAPEQVEAGIVAQVGLALRVSPTRARAQLRLARDLHAGLHRVREAFVAGELDERKVAAIDRAAAHLDGRERSEVDRQLCERDLPALGHRRVADLARSIVAAVAPEKFAERARIGCDAPIQHLDHVDRWSEGGPTTLGNGRGACAFHNLVREQPGWRVERRGSTRTTTTPTGRRYSLRL